MLFFALIVYVGLGLEASIDVETKKGDIKVNATVSVESQNEEKIQVSFQFSCLVLFSGCQGSRLVVCEGFE